MADRKCGSVLDRLVHIMGMLTHIGHYAASILFCRPSNSSQQSTPIFRFSASPSVRDPKAIVAAKGSEQDTRSMTTETFIQQHIPCSTWYICQIPLATPDAPFSRMLQQPPLVHELMGVSLSSVIGKSMDSDKSPSRDGSEFFCWEVMDHVLAFPYTHPDGMAPGTKDFEVWHMSIQKQYVLLLHESRDLLRKVLKCRECLNAARNAEYKVNLNQLEKLDRLATLEDELHQAEQEYNDVVRTIQGFRREQKMLGAAFHKVVVRCLKEAKTKAPSQHRHIQQSKYIWIGVGPLKRGSKRKAMDEHSRSSSMRTQNGHGFDRQQTKQRKLFEQDDIDLERGGQRQPKQRKLLKQAATLLEQGIAALNFSVPSSKDKQGPGDTASTASFEEASASSWEHVDDASDDTVVVSDNEHSEAYQADTSHLPLAQPTPFNPAQIKAHVLGDGTGSVETATTHLDLPKDGAKPASRNFQDLRDLEAVEAIYADLQRQFDEVQDMRARIAKTLQEGEPQPALAIEDVEAAIPATGIDYVDLVAELEGRVPDTGAGIKMLRELIDEAGFFNKDTCMVYPRGEVMFGWMVDP